MNKLNQPSILLLAYLLFLLISALITCAVILSSPSNPQNAIAFGYSFERLILAAGLILFSFAPLYLTLKMVKQPQQIQNLWDSFLKNNIFYLITFLSSFLFLLLLLFPSYRLGNFASYISRLYPILIWLTIGGLVTLGLFINSRRTDSLWSIILENKKILQVGLVSLIISILVLGTIVFTGIGIQQPEDYWFGAGVPVLGLQVIFTLFIGVLFAWFESRYKIKNIDLFLCLSLFIITAFLWAKEPLLPNYFMPDTAKNVMYPYSDSATFDIGSQFALIGQGLFNGQYFDRILYTSFLTYLHRWVGQDVEKILTIQSILFSVFPLIIYLIGKELHSRAFGVAIAFLISFRGINAILAATWIDLAGPKVMTTDFPTTIGISLFLLFAIKWIKDSSKLYFAVLAGGVLGLSMMLRTHVLFLALAFIFFILIIGLNLKWNIRWVGSVILIAGMLFATTPWDLRNLKNGTPMFYLYYSRIQTILEARYEIQGDSYLPTHNEFTLNQTVTRQRVLIQRDESGCEGQICKITNHFFHNLIASFLFLPSSFVFDGLWNTVKEGAPYWQIAWKGSGINAIQWFFIVNNLILVSLGIGVAWSKHNWLGMLPLILFLAYLVANALALTSAGRYVAPVDWVICLYYLLGIFQVVQWVTRQLKLMPMEQDQVEIKKAPRQVYRDEAVEFSSNQIRQAGIALLFIFGIGSLIPISEMLFEKRYEVRASEIIFAELQEKDLITQSGFSENELSEFLLQPNAMIVEGRALYPRYYLSGDGEPDRSTYYRRLDFSRLVFTVIGPYADLAQGVVIAGDKPNFPVHALDVIVLGCWNTTYYAPFIDAILVFFQSNEEDFVYTRSPEHSLECPLEEPLQ